MVRDQRNLNKIQQKIGIIFKNSHLLKQSVVHRSYINEHRDFPLDHNERLEFLGDAVLELVVTEYLYCTYPNPEGELTNWRASLVNGKNLSEVAMGIGIEEILYLSHGESKDQNPKAREYILANALEALIGAIYLDQGFAKSKEFIEKHIISKLDYILKHGLDKDPKSKFQEAAQERLGITPTYEVLEESGPDHNKHFKIGIYLEKELVAEGEGTSKQEAQVKAAENALEVKNWNNNHNS